MNKFVALLRGINVGGNNKVEMPRLRKLFESLGLENVKTYINSGNVIFETNQKGIKSLKDQIEIELHKTFGLSLQIVIRSQKNIQMLCKRIPANWTNDATERTDVFFLWDEVDSIKSLRLINKNPLVDTLRYFPGAIVWNIKRRNVNKSGLRKFIGTKVYKHMTARNINTLRKLNELMK
jgi:uncharacterized protein (DUF1697 family)